MELLKHIRLENEASSAVFMEELASHNGESSNRNLDLVLCRTRIRVMRFQQGRLDRLFTGATFWSL